MANYLWGALAPQEIQGRENRDQFGIISLDLYLCLDAADTIENLSEIRI
jgi:hypothetical protein